MTALLGACVAFQLNASMMSAVLPTMARELHTDEVAVGLSQTAFFTSGAIFGVFLPRLSDIRGRRLVLAALLVFVVLGSVLGALAPNIAVLDVARIIQGCSGPVVPICLLMLRSTVTEPGRYGTLMGLIAAVNGGVAGVDTLLGGYLATHVGFRGVFSDDGGRRGDRHRVRAQVGAGVASLRGHPDGLAWRRDPGARGGQRAVRAERGGQARLGPVGDGGRAARPRRCPAGGVLPGGEAPVGAAGQRRAPAPAGDLGAAADDAAHHDRHLRHDQRPGGHLRPGRPPRVRAAAGRDLAAAA